MRIAVSGAHGTGKSTLIAELARRLDGYQVVDELYYTLLDEGHVFAERPSAEDFELLLERSLAVVSDSTGPNILFDRCPADYLAYLSVVRRDDTVSLGGRNKRARQVLAHLKSTFPSTSHRSKANDQTTH
jgi:predicted ATPase